MGIPDLFAPAEELLTPEAGNPCSRSSRTTRG
jgi:hypothetical protein